MYILCVQILHSILRSAEVRPQLNHAISRKSTEKQGVRTVTNKQNAHKETSSSASVPLLKGMKDRWDARMDNFFILTCGKSDIQIDANFRPNFIVQ